MESCDLHPHSHGNPPDCLRGERNMSQRSVNTYTVAWCAWAAAGAALEIATLRCGNPDATLSAHSRLLFNRSAVTRAALIAACGWWAWHVLQPEGGTSWPSN